LYCMLPALMIVVKLISNTESRLRKITALEITPDITYNIDAPSRFALVSSNSAFSTNARAIFQ